MLEFIFTLPTNIMLLGLNLGIWGAAVYYVVEWVKDTLKDKGYL